MLHYIKTNVWDMIKNEKWFTFTIILTQAISVVVALFSSGMIYNFTIKEKAMEGTMLMIHMGKSEGNITDVKAKEIKESFPEVYELLGNKIESIDYGFLYEDTTGAKTDIASKLYYDVINNKYIWGEYDDFLMRKIGLDDKVFSIKDYQNGEKVMVGDGDYTKDEINNGINICGEKYKIKGTMDLHFVEELNKENYRMHIMPLMSVPDELFLGLMDINLERALNEDEYDELSILFSEKFGNRIRLPEFQGVTDIENFKTNRTLVMAGVVVLICVCINYCILYRVILEKRKKTMAIYRICGCTKWKGMIMYEAELLGFAVIMYLIFVCIYNKFIMPCFTGILEYMPEFYTMKTYIILGGLYLLILTITYTILVVGIVKKTPLTLSKEGGI